MIGFKQYIITEAGPEFVLVPPNRCKGYPVGVLEFPDRNNEMGLGHIIKRMKERVMMSDNDIIKTFTKLCSVIKKSDRGPHMIQITANGQRVGWLPFDLRVERDTGKMVIQLSTMLSPKMTPKESRDRWRDLELYATA